MGNLRKRLRGITALVGGLVAAVAVSAATAPQPSGIIETAEGPVRGRVDDGVAVFKVTPYAAPPAGERRFRAPAPAAPWAGGGFGGLRLAPVVEPLDMPLMFANVDASVALTGEGFEARALESQMSGAWLAFARTGDPNHPGLPEWPPYDATDRPTMIFDGTPKVVSDPKGDVRAILSDR